MKTFLLLFLAFGFSFTCFSQDYKNLIDFQEKEFYSQLQKENPNYLIISPLFKGNLDSLNIQFQIQKKLKEKLPEFIVERKSGIVYSSMPILKPTNDYWEMPVFVPDSTVNYTLKVKKIPFVNPLEKK